MATNFLHYSGGTGGLLGSADVGLFNNTDAAFDALTSGSAVTSANAGTSGVFTQSDFSSAQYGFIKFVNGDATWTPTAGGCLIGWWLLSDDNGTAYETLIATPSATQPALPRPPDFIVPLYEGGTAISTSAVKFSGLVRAPYLKCKVVCQNMSGATMSNTTTTHSKLFFAPVADQY